MTVWSRAVVIALLIGFGAPIFAEADEIDDYISARCGNCIFLAFRSPLFVMDESLKPKGMGSPILS